jgi:putative transposase
MNTRQPYPSDVTDSEWNIMEPLLVKKDKLGRGRKRKYPLREIYNAVRYLLRSGCGWRMIPHDFPRWQNCHRHFEDWTERGVLEKINAALTAAVREKAGRPPEPSKVIVDSQSVKTTEAGGGSGYDAGKKIKGRKRHILVDTLGLLLLVTVHSAGAQDGAGGAELLRKARGLPQFARVDEVRADAAYERKAPQEAAREAGWRMDIIRKLPDQKGFQVLPKRWVVERTFAWLGRDRRLAKDWEKLPEHSLAMVYLSSIRILLGKLSGRSSI